MTTIDNDEVSLWVDHRGDGPDVLLIAGLGDPAEAWGCQFDGLADRWHLIAYDNRGVGRSTMPDGPISVATMADDAAAVLDRLGVTNAHVAGFSGGGAIAQELALSRPELVRSLVLAGTWARADAFFTSLFTSWRWMAEAAPDERSFLEAFYLWVYTARAHQDGTVRRFIDEALAFPHQHSLESLQRQIDAFLAHDTLDRLHAITAPTLVLTGAQDLICPPRHGRCLADAIPGARFVLLDDGAHQPFQETPQTFNTLVDDFWRQSC